MTPELIQDIREKFIQLYGVTPVIVAAPGRINLIGGHTDYNEGFVLPGAINKGIVTAVQNSDSLHCNVFAINKNESYSFNLDTIQPIKKGDWRNFILGVVSEIQKRGIHLPSFNMVFGGDIPDGSGLSSSAALENSIAFAINEAFQLNIPKIELIKISQMAEHNFVGVKCGIMDQYASMFGIKNHVLMLDCRSLEAIPIQLPLQGYRLVLINSNIKHNLAEAAYNDRRSVCESIAKMLGAKALRDVSKEDLSKVQSQIPLNDYLKVLHIVNEIERVELAVKALKNSDLIAFGGYMFDSHHGASTMYDISCLELDFLVNEAKNFDGVIGARMMGGGFGGCSINIVAEHKVESYINHISAAYYKRFKTHATIECIDLSDGTHIISNEVSYHDR
jgi:galactokinase